MTQLIPFETKTLPSFLSKIGAPINDDLTAHAGGASFPVISIKGKVFTKVVSKERTVITRPDDPEEAATSLELVLLKANKNLSKVWYAKVWEEGDNASPDCSSEEGVKPDSSIESPQAKTCAVCPKNAWGSGKEGKGKACQDSRRIAVAAPDQLNEPMLLRVPPASLKPLAEYGKTLSNRGVPYAAVVTKVRFEKEVATPQLSFTPVGFLNEAQFAEANMIAASDLVNQIIGTSGVHFVESAEEFEQAPAAAAPKAVPKAKTKPAPVVEEPAAEEAPAPKAKPEPAKAAPKAAPLDMDEDLDALLGAMDD